MSPGGVTPTTATTHSHLEDEPAVPENTLTRELDGTLQYRLGICSAASLLVQLGQLTRRLEAHVVKPNDAHGERPLAGGNRNISDHRAMNTQGTLLTTKQKWEHDNLHKIMPT